MERSAEELVIEIDDVRGDLGQTLEEIGDRVAPKKVLDRTKADLAEKVDDAKQKVSPSRLTRRGTDAFRRGMRTAVGSDDKAGLAGGDQGRRVASRASEKASSAADSMSDAPRVARQKTQGNPVAAGLLALAGGFFVAALLPPSDKERELTEKAKEKLEPLTAPLVEAGKVAAGDLQSSAQQRLDKVKDTAADAAQQVKGHAVSSVDNVKGETVDAAQTVTEQTKTSAGRVKKQAKGSTSPVKGEAKTARTSNRR